MSDKLKTPWEIMPCPDNKGLHEYHDNRYIVTAGSELVKGFDPRGGNWGIRNGSLVCQMRDMPPLFARAIVHRVNCHDKLLEALEDCVAELAAAQGGHVKAVIAARSALELAKGGSHD